MLFAFIGMREFWPGRQSDESGRHRFGMVVDGSVVMVENMVQ
jgi:Cu/Ag efflux pump CusA